MSFFNVLCRYQELQTNVLDFCDRVDFDANVLEKMNSLLEKINNIIDLLKVTATTNQLWAVSFEETYESFFEEYHSILELAFNVESQ
jgi:DNA repair ATPase RecN